MDGKSAVDWFFLIFAVTANTICFVVLISDHVKLVRSLQEERKKMDEQTRAWAAGMNAEQRASADKAIQMAFEETKAKWAKKSKGRWSR
jgi:ABC-type transport system involved in cytochrome bd biosynthesis fused ATPase/permease subunit